MDPFIIGWSKQKINVLIDAIKFILDFNDTIQLDLVLKYKNQKMSELFYLGNTVKKYWSLR